jgi:hypothetical protein
MNVFGFQVREIREDLFGAHPSASISRMSVTRMRMPRMQGRPPHCAGLLVMRSLMCCLSMVIRLPGRDAVSLSTAFL